MASTFINLPVHEVSVDYVPAPIDTIPLVYNISIPLANVETALPLPPNTKGFVLKSRTLCRAKLAYAIGGTSSDYITIPLGGFWTDTNYYSNQIIYIRTDTNNITIELVAYV